MRAKKESRRSRNRGYKMANSINVRNEYQRKAIGLLESLVGKFTMWQVWQDFITMAATAICNSVPHPQREAREKLYAQCAEKYNAAELEIFAKMLANVTMGLEANPQQDFLGELFMALDLGNEWRGQFFTPYSVCALMADITLTEKALEKVKRHGWTDVNDPACGAGALLVAFANACLAKNINYQQQVLFVAQDVDQLAGMMCYIQLSLLGCAGYVVVQNTFFDTYPAMYNEAKTYSRKHIGQVYGPKQNITTPKVDESLEDIMVYAAILLYLHRKYNEQIAEVEKEE